MASLALQRSKQTLERDGWQVWIVEKFNQWSMQRQDLFNMADLVAIRSDRCGVTGIQCCSEDVQPHIRKIMEGWTDSKGKVHPPNPYIKTWLQAGNPFFIWAWRKRGEQGKRKTWQLREVEFIFKDGVVVAEEIQTIEELEPVAVDSLSPARKGT